MKTALTFVIQDSRGSPSLFPYQILCLRLSIFQLTFLFFVVLAVAYAVTTVTTFR
jgi:hypothetical protein